MVTRKNTQSFFQKNTQTAPSGNTLFVFFVGCICSYFVVRLVFYACTIPHHLPPDEITHFDYIKVFAQGWGFPKNSVATYQLGNLTHIPWLYYYFMGKFLSLNFFSITDLLYIRFINVFFTCCMVIYGFLWISLVTEIKLTRLFFLVLLTNIPMLTFLGASVSYDNLLNLCAVIALYYIHLFFLFRNPAYFFTAGIAVFIGSLTKISFLPLAVIFTGIVFFHERKNLVGMARFLKVLPEQLNWGGRGLALLFVLLAVMCFDLYGGNLLKYKKLVPAADQVMTEDQFMQQRIVARDYIISQYRSGEWTYREAVSKAQTISHPSDQRTALHVLKIQEKNKKTALPIMSRLAYSYFWLDTIVSSCVGICGHRSIIKNTDELAAYKAIFFIFFIAVVRFWRIETAGFLINQSIVIVFCYALFLMLYHNYNIYLSSLNQSQSIQGRYIFPVLIPLVGVMAYYLTNFFKKGLTWLLVVLICFFFIWGDFPYYQAHANVSWFKKLEDGFYYFQRGNYYKESGNIDQAVVEFKQASQLEPENAWYHRFLGDMYGEMSLQRKALEQYLLAIELQPKVAGFYYLAGKTHLEMGHFERAVENYKMAIALDPKNVWYHRFLGDLYRDRTIFTKAVQQYRVVLQIEQENKYALKELIRIESKQRK